MVSALAPGIGNTRWPAARTAATSSAPGSLTAGVPASETNATDLPCAIQSTTLRAPPCSLWAWSATSFAPMPKCVSSPRVTRVSSAATMSTERKVSNARCVTSPRFPMGVATTYNPGSMPRRCNALLFFVLATMATPAFSADPPAGTTFSDDIDPAPGLARSSVVRPLGDAPPVPEARALPRTPVRPHIALILPTASPQLGRVADAVRQGFMAAVEAAGRDGLPVLVTAIDNEGTALVEACRAAQASGALIVVGGITRDGAHALANSDCARQPVLALNELRGEIPRGVYSASLSLEQEARQAALLAVADGWRSALVIATRSPLSGRVQEAFEREWSRAAGESRRILFSGNLDDAPAIRERIANSRGDMVFLALDQAEARAVRPYISGMLPIYATSLSVNPRAEAIVNVDLQGVRYVEMPWFVHPDHPAVMIYPAPKGAMSVDHERLYAFGIDAQRIALQLLRGDPARPLDGVTGRITLEATHVFARTLAPAEVDGGRIIPLRTAP